MDPRAALAAFVIASGAIAAISGLAIAAAALGLAVTAARLAGTPARRLAVRLLAVALALAPLAALMVFFAGLDGLTWTVLVVFKALAIAAAAMALGAVVTENRLAWAARRFLLPPAVVRVAQIAGRFQAVVGSELRRMQAAAAARGFQPSFHQHSIRTYGALLGSLAARSANRAQRLAEAARCRGGFGDIRLLREPTWHWRDAALVAAVSVAGAGLVAADFALRS